MAKIIISNLKKRFGNKIVLKNINLEINEGEFFAYVGPNGSGKTTTIRILLGVLNPDEGEARIVMDENTFLPKDKIGFVLEEEKPFENFTPEEYLKFYAEIYQVINSKEKIENLLKKLNIYERRKDKIFTLSKGTRKKLCIAKALLIEPEVLFLDEPLEGIEIEARREIKELLIKLAKQKKIIFITSHNLYEISSLCSSFGIIIDGELKGKWRRDALKNINLELEDFYFKIKDANKNEIFDKI